MDRVKTQHLHLIPLTLAQLEIGLISINNLSANLGVPLTHTLFEGIVERAVKMKVEKMQTAPEYMHPWFTYWLIFLLDENIGAGLIGFKGIPNDNGEVEIGYGIAEPFRKRRYMTEAAGALIEWAFSHPQCQSVTATGVLRSNIGSQRVLLNLGFTETSSDEETLNFRLSQEKRR